MPKVIAEAHIKFMIVPRDLWRDKTLSLSAKAVYVDLLSYSNKIGECFPSRKRIAADLGISRSTIERALKELAISGWIKITSGKRKGTVNHYLLRSEGYVKMMQGVPQNEVGVPPSEVGGTSPEGHEGIPKEGIPNNKGHDLFCPSLKNPYNGEGTFKRFWDIYTRKVKKKDAKKVFLKLQPDDTLFERMISAIQKQMRWRENEKRANRFAPDWPHPTSWLNGERWEDEIPEEELAECPF